MSIATKSKLSPVVVLDPGSPDAPVGNVRSAIEKAYGKKDVEVSVSMPTGNYSVSQPGNSNLVAVNAEVLPSKVPAHVRDWICEQARAGIGAETVMQALLGNGWDSGVAAQMLRASMEEMHPGIFYNTKYPHEYITPEPLIKPGQRFLDVGDRMVEIAMVCDMPRVVVFDDFMSAEECDALIELSRPRLAPSTVVQPMTGQGVSDSARTSTGMFFNLQENDLVKVVENRIARLLHWPVENGEGIQVLNYQAGAEYKPHQDYFDPADPGTPKQVGLAGQRVGTLLMYLNTPEAGGGTIFPDAGNLEVMAKKGRAVLFTYDQPVVHKRVLHGGSPVLSCEKWAATKWMRQRSFMPKCVPQPC